MAKQHKELRKALMDKELEHRDLCVQIGRSPGYLNERMMGRKPFSMQDVYTICKVLDIPVTEIHTYFPPQNGW